MSGTHELQQELECAENSKVTVVEAPELGTGSERCW